MVKIHFNQISEIKTGFGHSLIQTDFDQSKLKSLLVASRSLNGVNKEELNHWKISSSS